MQRYAAGLDRSAFQELFARHGGRVHGFFARGTRDAALRFAGAAAPGCHLVDGPTQDLNLMLRSARGVLQRWQHGLPWPADFAQRGLYTTVAGRWRCGERTLPLPAHHLLWASAAGAGTWTFEPDTDPATGSAWWIGATLQD